MCPCKVFQLQLFLRSQDVRQLAIAGGTIGTLAVRNPQTLSSIINRSKELRADLGKDII